MLFLWLGYILIDIPMYKNNLVNLVQQMIRSPSEDQTHMGQMCNLISCMLQLSRILLLVEH